MTEPVREQLSACLDGELSRAELDLLIKRVAKDSELQQTLGRYALIAEAVRGNSAVRASGDFSARVMAAVQHEPNDRRVAVPGSARRWLRPIAGMGVAASVAAVAMFSVQQSGVMPQMVAESDPAVQGVEMQPMPGESPSYVVPTATTSSAFIPATRLTNYVVAHSEFASPLGRRTVLSGVLAEEEDEALAQDDVSDEIPLDSSQDARR